jgi:hypothetical protein
MDVFLAWFTANNPDLMKSDIDSDFSRQLRNSREKAMILRARRHFI